MAVSFESARDMILECVAVLPHEAVSLLDVVGRVLAEDIRAPWDMPRWNNSAMDGFAVRAEDCASGQPLTVDGYLPAGSSASGVTVRLGTAARIMTGPPRPLAAILQRSAVNSNGIPMPSVTCIRTTGLGKS